MSIRFTREQLLEGLTSIIAESLQVEPELVTPDAMYFSILDGESLELLDISFQVQKKFGIRMRFQELFDGWEFDPDGKLSAGTEQNLITKFPQIDWSTRIAAMSGDDPRDLLTVGLIAELLFHSQNPSGQTVEVSR